MKTEQLTAEEYLRQPWLNIYGQDHPHSEAEIIGTRSGLVALRDLLDVVLTDLGLPEGACTKEFVATDGEGYAIRLQRIEPDQINKTSPLYTSYLEDSR